LTIFLADDHEVICRGAAELLDAEPDLTVIGQAASTAETLVRVPAFDPDMIVLTAVERDECVFDSLRAGASGFLGQDIDPRGRQVVVNHTNELPVPTVVHLN
jgi:DNA-binding NarL/FixJ family response regulator